MKRSIFAAVSAVAIVAAVASIAAASSGTKSSAKALAASVNVGIGTTVTYHSGMKSDPAPPGTVTRLSSDDAMRIAERISPEGDMTPGDPTVSLRVVTLSVGRDGVVLPGSSDSPVSFAGRTAWVFEWANSVAFISNPLPVGDGLATRQPLKPSDLNCTFVIAVDAHSGVGLDSEQNCQPRAQ